jgi:hypothetical protein
MIDEHWERRPDGTAVRVLRETALGGIAWRIWMADTRGVPGARAEHCLIFDTADRVRRVWSVPEDWGQMPAEMLIALADAGASRVAPLRELSGRETPLREASPRAGAEPYAPDAR